MGIEQFFKSITSTSSIISSATTLESKEKYNITHMYIDFNSIIHTISAHVVHELNSILKSLIFKKPINITIVPKEWLVGDLNYFKEQVNIHLDDIIIEKIIEKIIDIVKNNLILDTLKLLFFSFDGVPMFSKAIEQKKRRWMGTLISKTKKEIYNKWSEEIKKNDHDQYMYDELKIEWSKNIISPGTYFMKKMSKKLRQKEFINKIKKICINLEKIIISDTRYFGEGEKKIVDYIQKQNNTNTFMIYSPDADMTILSLILHDKNILILREIENTDVINITQMRTMLIQWVYSITKINNKYIIDDIAFIFTMFGNDFLPKMKSISVKNDFMFLLHSYCKLLIDYNITILQKNKINSYALFMFLDIIQKGEDYRLYYNYMDKHWKNFKFVVNILDPKLELSFDQLCKKVRQVGMEWTANNINPTILKLTNNVDPSNENVRFELYLRPRIKHSYIDDIIIKNDVIKDYYLELLDFENMTGEYKYKLSVSETKHALVSVNNFEWTPHIIKRENDQAKIKNFLTGLKWLQSYYYNKWNGKYSKWYYKYENAPTLEELYKFMKKNPKFMNSIKLESYETLSWNSPQQHLIYVTPPVKEYKYLTKVYNAKTDNIINTLAKLLAKDIKQLNKKEIKFIKQHITCNQALYLSKCSFSM